MKFEEASDPHYARWFVSENGTFFIGVLNYLFEQKCIQVLFKNLPEYQDRYVIREWRTYKAELVDQLIEKINHNLANIEAGWGTGHSWRSSFPRSGRNIWRMNLKRKKVSKAQVKAKADIQIIIGPGRITLVNLQRATKQYIELSPEQAKALGMEEEAILAERMGNEKV